MERDHQGAFTQDHGHGLGAVIARSALLEGDRRLGDLLRHTCLDLFIAIFLMFGTAPRHRGEKNTGMAEHPRVFSHAGLLANGPPGTAGLSFI